MRNHNWCSFYALILAVAWLAIITTLAQKEQSGPPPPRLSSEQQERAEHWRSVLNDYFESSYRPVNTSVTQDYESLSNRLGDEYALTKEQVERIQWFHEQHAATVAAIEARQDEGRTNYGPYPILRLEIDSGDTYKAEIELSPDGKKITAFYGPFLSNPPVESSG